MRKTSPAATGCWRWPAGLDPETVQLDYQIAVQGRSDLSVAPDEFAGFSMTLMRMLAFAPGGGQAPLTAGPKPDTAAAARSAKAAPEAAPVDKPASARRMPAPDTSAGAATSAEDRSGSRAMPEAAIAADLGAAGTADIALDPSVIQAADAAISDWPGWIAQCRLGGLAQQLAYNAELKTHRRTPTGIEMELALTENNRHLAERAYQEKLREALSSALGAPVRLRIEIGGEGAGSMAAQDKRARQLLQENATASFNDDPFVREAVRLFDARVRPQSIQPVTMQQGNKS